MEAERNRDLRGLWLAVGFYAVILAMKLVTYFLTGVMAVLAEALHTLSDIFISGFLLAATIYSRHKPDATHPFGYARAQNAAALVAATLFISFTSYKLYEESIPRLFKAEEATYRNLPLAIGILVASMVIAAIPLISLFRSKRRGATAKAQLMELVNDEMGLVAALLGTLSVLWGWPAGDPLAAIALATLIAYNAVKLFRENLSFLLGRSPGEEYLARMQELARSVPGVLDVHDIRAEYIGPGVVHAGMHITVPRGLTIEEADRISREVDQRVHEGVPDGFCVIHVDPAAESVPRSRVAAAAA